jgi:hypothetical protein
MSTKTEKVVYTAFLMQSFFDRFLVSEFFNRHACLQKLLPVSRHSGAIAKVSPDLVTIELFSGRFCSTLSGCLSLQHSLKPPCRPAAEQQSLLR